MNLHDVSKKISRLVTNYCNANTTRRKDKLLLNKINATKAFSFQILDPPLLTSKTPLSRGGTQ
jgi:hypothetical protein